MKLFTIGFTKTTAKDFFTKLQDAGSTRLVDVRLNNVSQLAGFAKRDDLKYFLSAICSMDYLHLPLLAPTQDILDEYKKNKGDWYVYEEKFMQLMRSRQIELRLQRQDLDNCCLLCSEDTPHHCHRRLVAEYLKEKWGNVEIKHII